MIKKFIIPAFVVLTFVVYSLHQRGEGSEAVSRVATNTAASQTTKVTNSSSSPAAIYKDGTYTGAEADAFYGFIQVKATVSGGRLTDVAFLQYPNDRSDSVAINQYAMPQLKQQAIQVQSAQVDGVSGATDTSQAFIQSLGDALSQAKA